MNLETKVNPLNILTSTAVNKINLPGTTNIVSPVAYKNVGGNTINTYYNGGVCFNKAQLYAVICQYAGIVSRVVTG